MKIRLAAREDVGAVESLYAVLYDSASAYEPTYYQGASVGEGQLLEIFAGEDSDLLVAEEEGNIVGFVLLKEVCTQSDSSIIPLRYALVADLAVHPVHQEKGVGTALITEAKNWAHARKLDYMELQVLERNAGARKLYQRQGFRTVTHVMRCSLD